VNCRFIREFLNNDGIPLVASNLGGDRGRVIRFSSIDYTVRMRMIKKSVAPELANKEKRFWLNSIKSHDVATPEPDLWG
jgi:chemotaxis protein CheD